MSNVAVILAAGAGTRMKSKKSKLLLELCGRTIVERTVELFARISDIDEIIVVCREKELADFEEVLSRYDISYCFGGDTRQQSVTNAVETVGDCDMLIIHDGARPLVTEEEIISTLKAAKERGAAAVGVPVKDTIKVIDGEGCITATPDRSSLIAIRTPQIFSFELYREALDAANAQGKDFTDDCALIENLGKKVYTVIGEYTNIKITTPEDILLAESILKARGE